MCSYLRRIPNSDGSIHNHLWIPRGDDIAIVVLHKILANVIGRIVQVPLKERRGQF